MRRAILCGMVLLLAPFGANAASFDCKKAKSAVEMAICSDPVLSKLDDEMAKTYRLARRSASDKQSVQQRQRTWLEKRGGIEKRPECSGDGLEACLIKSYEDRLNVLRGPHAGVYVRGERYKYKVLDDQAGATVCDQFLDLLERSGHPRLACGVGPIPAGPFSRPDWKSVDAWEHRDWIAQILLDWHKRKQTSFPEDQRAAFERNVERDIRDGAYTLAVGQISVLGKLRDAVRFSVPNRCDEACDRASCDRAGRHFLLSDDAKNLLLDETAKIGRGLGYSSAAGAITDLLSIDNATYTTNWGGPNYPTPDWPVAWLYGINGNDGECSYTLMRETQ